MWLETIAVEYRTCRLVVDRCIFLSLMSLQVCFGLRTVWYRYVVVVSPSIILSFECNHISTTGKKTSPV